jgi:beta-galactosidase
VDLPHDWSIEGKTDAKNPSGNDGGYFPTGIGWYRKTFKFPSLLQQKKIGIYFEGVYMNAEVYINGKSLGIRPYGYSAFYYDLSPYLNFDKENIIAVRVDNSRQRNSRWYSGSGIYRHVWLTVTNPIYIDQWGTTVRTPNVILAEAVVQVKTVVKNETSSPQSITLISRIEKDNGKEAGTNTLKVEVPANSSKEVEQLMTVKAPQLWSPAKPNLYKAITTINKEGKPIDTEVTKFGVRTLEFSTTHGFLLNGKQVILNGGCAHHDNGFLGATAYDRAEEKKVELIKAAGFNAVRTSHNPPSEAFLDACDRLGLLVMDESFDGWRESKTQYDYTTNFNEWWQRDIAAMVLRDRNHPSIFMWSTGNEIIERKKPQAVETAKALTGYIHQLDPTRPVTSAITTWDKDWEILDSLFAAHDIGGYNYQLHRATADHVRVPSRIIIQTESFPRDAFANWKLVTDNKYILGDFVWTAIDYLGESAIGRYFYEGEIEGQHWQKNFFPWHGAYCGDIDLTGWRKPISHYRDLLYNDNIKLYLAVKEPNDFIGKIKETLWSVWPTWESWTWPGMEGKDVQVEVYSRYPAVRLYLNNKLIGEQLTGVAEQFKATFNVPYGAGVLRAIGMRDGKEQQSMTLKTAGEAAFIKFTADRKTIKANGQDLSYVTIEITDKDGTLQPNGESELSFQIKGAGVMAATGNGNLQDTNPYVATNSKTWKGRAMVIIKSTHDRGNITLEVSAPGLPKASVVINAN